MGRGTSLIQPDCLASTLADEGLLEAIELMVWLASIKCSESWRSWVMSGGCGRSVCVQYDLFRYRSGLEMS